MAVFPEIGSRGQKCPLIFLLVVNDMEKCIQHSVYSKGNLIWIFLGAAALVAWFLFQVQEILYGRINILVVAYFLLFAGLFVWRYGFTYTYTLTESELIIQSRCLHFSRVSKIPLETIEFYSDRYKRSMFRKLGLRVSCYQYQYCGGDGNRTRVLLFLRNGKKEAVLFKVNEAFMEKLEAALPGKYLDVQRL